MSAAGRESDGYDVVVVGGGAAGLSGAKLMVRSRRSVLLVDAGAPRNAPAGGVHNYLYAEGRPPAELRETGRAEARAYGVELVTGTATSAAVLEQRPPGGPRFEVELTAADGRPRVVTARRLLLATGLVDVLPDVQGLAERWGTDVLHCPFCHGWEVRDQAIGVLGTGPMSIHQVLLFSQLTDDLVYLQHTAPDPGEEQREQLAALGVEHVVGEVRAVQTRDGRLSGLQLANGRVVGRQALAVATTVQAREDLVADLGLAMSDLEVAGTVLGRFLAAGPTGATVAPGVWAAGNVSAPMAQVIGAAAEGAAAGSAIHMDLITEDTALAVQARRGANPGVIPV